MQLTLRGGKDFPVLYSKRYERTTVLVVLDVEGVRLSKCYALDNTLKVEKNSRLLACAWAKYY